MNASEAVSPGEERSRARLLGPYRILVGNRTLSLLCVAHVLSELVDWLYLVALLALVYSLTHSPSLIATLTFLRLLPYALLLPVSGLLVDHRSPTALMVSANLGRGVCMLGLIAVYTRGALPLAFVLIFASATFSSLFRPALNAVLPATAGERRVADAYSLVGQIDMVALGAGPVLGGLVVTAGVQSGFLAAALAYFAAGGAVISARVLRPPRDTRDEGAWVAQLSSGFHVLFRSHHAVLLGFALPLVGLSVYNGASWTVTVVLASTAFHLGPQGLGFLYGVYGAGGLVGSLLIGRLTLRRGLGSLFIGTSGLCAIGAILYGLSPAGVLPFAFSMGIGTAEVMARVIAATVLQTATPGALLGRAFGAFESILVLSMALGAAAAGPIVSMLGGRAANLAFTLAALLSVVLAALLVARLDTTLGIRMFLRHVPILRPLSLQVLDDLVAAMQLERYTAGQTIIREGDPGDRFYIVKSGRVDVRAHGGADRERQLARMARSDYFGELALLRDEPRTATVTARGKVEVYALCRADFQSLLQQSDAFRASLIGRGESRDRERWSRLMRLR